MIEYLSGQTLEEVLTEEITLVDYFANWCGPCKMIGMELEELTNTHIIKVDVDTHEELAKTHGVMSIPTIEIYKNKKLVKTIIGYKTKDELEPQMVIFSFLKYYLHSYLARGIILIALKGGKNSD